MQTKSDALLRRLEKNNIKGFYNKDFAGCFLEEFIFTYLRTAYDTTTRDDIRTIVSGTVPKDMSVADVLQIIGLKDACAEMITTAKVKKRLSVDTVISLNAYTFLDKKELWGKFRTDNTLHLKQPKLYASADEIEDKLTEMVTHYNMNCRTHSPLDCAASLYLDCLRASPFTLNNEATALLLMDCMLLSNDIPPVIFSRSELADVMHKTALNSYCLSGDIRCMTELIIKAINKDLDKYGKEK